MKSILQKAIQVSTLLFCLCMLAALTQAQRNAAVRAVTLREKLVEVLAKQEELQTRLAQLEDGLKPENIEKSLAGVGSTRPEELRELRRRQLDVERSSIQDQLKQLSESKTRLEAAILQADTAAYHRSATENMEKSGSQVKADRVQPDRVQKVQRPRRIRPRSQRVRHVTQY